MDHLDELLIAARDGNRLAFDRFVDEMLPAVRQLCWQLGDPDSHEELVQETWLRASRSLTRFEGHRRGSARAWLLRIARNTCADAARSRARRRTREAMVELPEVAAPPASGWAEVHSLLAGLNEERRQAFMLTQVLNLPYHEAAEILDVPIGTIRSRVARARSELLDVLETATASEAAAS